MHSRSYRTRSAFEHTPLHRRVSGAGLALAAVLLIVLALLGLGASRRLPGNPSSATVVDLIVPSDQAEPSPSKAERPRPMDEPVPIPPPPIILPIKPPIILPPVPERPLDMIELTKEDYAAADIGKLAPPEEGAGSGGAGDSKEAGRGPNGEVLYNAEWAREPTNAELRGYLPARISSGWGVVACRTIAGHRVEDCIELENHPRGSRLASAVRQAAWQFRVRPPRRNGRELVGAWVMIRIDYELREE